jgi:uncharacterized membrane protein HdeD (DUF308 family)
VNDLRTTAMANATKSATLIGVGLIILGILAMALPRQSGIAVAVGAGVLLLLGGVFRIFFLFLSPTWGSLFLRFFFGLASIVAGGIMILDPVVGLNALTVVAIAYFLVDGATEILMGFQLPPGAGGFWVVAGGVLSLLLGIMLWRSWPVSGEVAVPILIGIKLLFTGIVVLVVSRASRAIIGKLEH